MLPKSSQGSGRQGGSWRNEEEEEKEGAGPRSQSKSSSSSSEEKVDEQSDQKPAVSQSD
jgi:hypothetical protein